MFTKKSVHVGIASCLALAGVIAGCSSNDSDSSTTSTTPSLDFSSTLLTASDLGTDWTKQQGESFTSRNLVPAIEEQSWCPQASVEVEQLKGLAGLTGAIVGLKQSVAKSTSHQFIEQVWTGDHATEFVQTFGDAVQKCDSQTWMGTADEEFNFDAQDVPAIGDDGAAASLMLTTTSGSSSYTWTTRMVAVRTGDYVVQIRDVDVHKSGANTNLSDDEWQTLVTTAAQKVIDATS